MFGNMDNREYDKQSTILALLRALLHKLCIIKINLLSQNHVLCDGLDY